MPNLKPALAAYYLERANRLLPLEERGNIPVPATPPTVEIHSMAPWWIVRYQIQIKRTAINSLTREGFECWAPTYKAIRPTYLRKIPPKQRHMANRFITEKLVDRFPGYLFIRRLRGCYDINRLFDLKGCGGLVTIAGAAATLADHHVEIMRLIEARGIYDAAELANPNRYRVTRLPPEARALWTGQSRLDGRLDESGTMRLSVQAFGRVEYIIAAADGTGGHTRCEA